MCIVTQSFTGEFVANTIASAVTVCLSDVFTCGRRGRFSNSATWDPQWMRPPSLTIALASPVR